MQPQVLILLPRVYNRDELWGVAKALRPDYIVRTMSTEKWARAEGVAERLKVDYVVGEVDPSELVELHVGLVIVSGFIALTEEYWLDPYVNTLVQSFHEGDKVLGAVCCAVPSLHPVLSGRQVSCYQVIKNQQFLRDRGAVVRSVAVSVDGNIITAEHSMAMAIWMDGFRALLNGEPFDPGLQIDAYKGRGKPRRDIPELEAIKRSRQ